MLRAWRVHPLARKHSAGNGQPWCSSELYGEGMTPVPSRDAQDCCTRPATSMKSYGLYQVEK